MIRASMPKPASNSALSEWWEGFAPWAPYLAIAAVGGALYFGATVGQYEGLVTEILAFSAPVVAFAVVLVKLAGAPTQPRALVTLSALLILLASLSGVSLALHPPGRLGAVVVSEEAPSAELVVPRDVPRFSVYSSARLIPSGTDGNYDLRVSRDEGVATIRGTVSKRVEEGGRSRRSVVPTRTTVVHASERHDVALPGEGPLTLSFEHASSQVRPRVDAAVYRYSPLRDVLPVVFLALIALSLFAEAFVAARHLPVPVTASAGFSAVFGFYMMGYYEAGGVRSLIGALVLAFVAGAGVGFLGGHLFARWLSPKLP
jgi:hypothetical protein